MEIRSLTDRAVKPDPTSVHLDDLTGDRQSKSGAADSIGATGSVCEVTLKTNEQPVVEVGRHPWAMVFDRHHDGLIIKLACHLSRC